MFKFTKTRVFLLAIFILFCLLEIFIYKNIFEIEQNEPIMITTEGTPVAYTEEKNRLWEIEIPKISLIAQISNGTTLEILEKHIGHFENTSKKEGNIGLAMFSKELKKLREGDKIFYRCDEFEKIYEIEKCRIIKNTELKYLEETEENRLTLITYVENHTGYRRCIQAVEKD